MPVIVMMARENRTIFSVDPERWIVAASGTTNPATGRLTPLAWTHRRVTGIVAAEDEGRNRVVGHARMR